MQHTYLLTLLFCNLQDTTKNLKTLDHMLDNYRDVSRDQRSANDRVRFWRTGSDSASLLCFVFLWFDLLCAVFFSFVVLKVESDFENFNFDATCVCVVV